MPLLLSRARDKKERQKQTIRYRRFPSSLDTHTHTPPCSPALRVVGQEHDNVRAAFLQAACGSSSRQQQQRDNSSCPGRHLPCSQTDTDKSNDPFRTQPSPLTGVYPQTLSKALILRTSDTFLWNEQARFIEKTRRSSPNSPTTGSFQKCLSLFFAFSIFYRAALAGLHRGGCGLRI